MHTDRIPGAPRDEGVGAEEHESVAEGVDVHAVGPSRWIRLKVEGLDGLKVQTSVSPTDLNPTGSRVNNHTCVDIIVRTCQTEERVRPRV